jgi:hypothetical protein
MVDNINKYFKLFYDGSVPVLFDKYPLAARMHSLRLLNRNSLFPLIRVRRTVTNTELDIFPNFYGELDT